jgi:hypothetical protein
MAAEARSPTSRQVFAAFVCAEIGKRFGVPADKFGFIREVMLKPGVDHLREAARLMATLGVGVYLLTDLEETFLVDSEVEFRDLFEMGIFGGDQDAGYILLKLNPIVNRLLGCLKEPIKLESHGAGYQAMRNMRGYAEARGKEEQRLLAALRTGHFEKIEIRLQDGTAKLFKGTTRHKINDQKEIARLIESHDYQSVTLIRHDGRIVGVEQIQTERLDRT